MAILHPAKSENHLERQWNGYLVYKQLLGRLITLQPSALIAPNPHHVTSRRQGAVAARSRRHLRQLVENPSCSDDVVGSKHLHVASASLYTTPVRPGARVGRVPKK